MSGYLSVYGANAILDGTAMPTTFYGKGHLTNPGNAGTAGAAAETRRLIIPRSAAVAGVSTNPNPYVLTGAAANEDWAYLTLWSAASLGNCWWIVPLVTPISILVGGNIELLALDLILSFPRWGD